MASCLRFVFIIWVCLAQRLLISEHFEDDFVNVPLSVIKPKFTFLQMETKRLLWSSQNRTSCVLKKA